jgi:hypothetical protein
MNLYKESKKEYKKNKGRFLRILKRKLWWIGAKPKQWEYMYMNGEWSAFHPVDDMEIIARLDTYQSGGIGDVYFKVSYFDKGLELMIHSDTFYYFSDVKNYIGKRIVEEE